jgi:hypothetical protein
MNRTKYKQRKFVDVGLLGYDAVLCMQLKRFKRRYRIQVQVFSVHAINSVTDVIKVISSCLHGCTERYSLKLCALSSDVIRLKCLFEQLQYLLYL